MNKSKTQDFFLGDNGGRPVFWPRPTHFDLAAFFKRLIHNEPDRPRAAYAMARSLFKSYALAKNPDSKPFAHPYYWAAFTYNGACSYGLHGAAKPK